MTMACDIIGGRRSAVRRATTNLIAGALLGIALALMWFPSPAKAWWNDDWQLRKKITIDASASGANITDPIGATPVLIRLHVGNFRFGADGEWDQSRFLTVQYRNITGKTLDQFSDPAKVAVIDPPQFQTDKLIYPYADAVK